MWAGSRMHVPAKSSVTVLARMTPDSYTPVLTLPSGGDCSYPGLVWHGGLLWMSYYSSHEGKSSIYLARVELPPARSADSAARRRLLLDSRVVESVDNARLVPGPVRKAPENPLLTEQQPWEPRFDNLYPNVLFDEQEGLYKCWYSPFIIDQAVTRTPAERRATLSYMDALHGNERYAGVCYATSLDGLNWTRPGLGLVDFEGSRNNNIVLRNVHGAGVWKDLRDPDPARRYKMLAKAGEDREPMGVAFSADGLRWSAVRTCPEMQAVGDTHNNSLWDEPLDSYVAFTRLWDGQRVVGRSTSRDFVQWSAATAVLRGTAERQTYALPVFRHAGVYLGLVAILDTRSELVDCELAWSPDGIGWRRVAEGAPLIPRGPAGSFDDGCVFPAAYPLLGAGEIRLYYAGSDGQHAGWRKGGLGLARLRPDGFAGYAPQDAGRPGVVTSIPLPWNQRPPRVSVDGQGGSVLVEVLDEQGTRLGRSRPLRANVNDAALEWEVTPARVRAGAPVRLRFELDRASLYSFTW